MTNMQEKDLVLDILSGTKAGLSSYAKVIQETANPTLRQTFQQMRDGDDKFQYELYQIVEQKGYYVGSPQATQQDMQSVKQCLSGACSAQAMH